MTRNQPGLNPSSANWASLSAGKITLPLHPPPAVVLTGTPDDVAQVEAPGPTFPHVLFLNAQDGLGADVAVHLMLAKVLDRRKLRVSAATSAREASGVSARRTFESIPDLSLLTLDLGRPIGRQRGLARGMALLDNVRAMASLIGLARWCRANHVDVIHVTERPRQSLFGLLVARMAGCACLIHAHTVYYPRDATQLANARLRQADAVVGVSHFVASSFERVGRLAPSRVFAVHNAVDGEAFRSSTADGGRAQMRQRLGIANDAVVIGCVARLMQWKGQGTLLEAFAAVRQTVPNARLVLPGLSADAAPDGVGDYRDYLVRRTVALGIQDAVIFPGFIPQPEMPEFYGALDLLAHPSVEEPFGLAVVEAMASARPVVAVNGGGIPEIIREGVDGLLVPAEQPAALADAILRVLGDRELAARLARSGRERVVDSFSPAIQAAAMLKVYQQIVTARRSHA